MGWNPFNKEINEQEQQHKYNTQENLTKTAMESDAMNAHNEIERQERENLTRWQQDLEPELQMLIHDLRREFYNGETWEREKDIKGKETPPMCNDLFIRSLIALSRPLTSRNLMMSNYSEDIIQTELRSSMFEFILRVGPNHKLYDINKEDLSMLVRVFKSHIRPTFYRAFNAGERSLMKTTVKEHTIRTSNENQAARKGLLGG